MNMGTIGDQKGEGKFFTLLLIISREKNISLTTLKDVYKMEWLIVFMLILIGAILVLLEILVFPGINVAGILGIACVIAGVYFGYAFYGKVVGHFVLLGTAIFGIGATWYALRANTWKRLSLDTRLEGTVEGVDSSVCVGDEGKTLGRMAPMGNVRIGDYVVEAESVNGYIDANQVVEVVKVFKNKVVVKLKSN